MGNVEKVHGIKYKKPQVILFQHNGIGVAEYAGRCAYDSFDKSEHLDIREFEMVIKDNPGEIVKNTYLKRINDIQDSKLLDQLAWVHHHHSVIEHAVLSYYIKGTSRGVLQELARHRIASYTVRSTRYTMSSIVNAFVTCISVFEDEGESLDFFRQKIKDFNLLVLDDEFMIEIEADSMYQKMMYQCDAIVIETDELDEFYKICLSKENLEFIKTVGIDSDPEDVFKTLENGKKKRNVGDAFKHIVTDNWKTDLMMTINLRSLKNFFDLRDSGAAYFQIRWLAEEMKKVTPEKYLRLIDKDYREKG